jgi:hypothetical protein
MNTNVMSTTISPCVVAEGLSSRLETSVEVVRVVFEGLPSRMVLVVEGKKGTDPSNIEQGSGFPPATTMLLGGRVERLGCCRRVSLF